MRNRFRHVAASFALLAAGASAQEIYRWTDADATVHFGHIAPHGLPYETVNSMGRGPSPPRSMYNPYQRREPPATTAARDVAPVADSDGPAMTQEQLERQCELEAEAKARLAEAQEAIVLNCDEAG